MKSGKRSIDPNSFNIAAIDELSQKMLDMPIKKSKQIQEIFKLRAEQQKILQKMNSKLPKSLPKDSLINKSTLLNSLNKLQSHTENGSSSSYIVRCIIRSLGFRKLAIDDIAQIFGIKAEIVEEIDKFRRLEEFESGDLKSNPKLEAMRGSIMQKVEQSLGNLIIPKVSQANLNSKSYQKLRKLNQLKLNNSLSPKDQDQELNCNNDLKISQAKRIIAAQSNYSAERYSDLNDITDSLGQVHHKVGQQNVFEFQRILRNKPPHRLDKKIDAIVEIIKTRPNLTQKDMLKVLADEYDIRDMAQTSISRYIKRIYYMKRLVDVILQAQKDGFVVM